MWTEGCIGLFGMLLCCFSLWDMAWWLCHGVCIIRGLGGDYRWCWRKVTLIFWRRGLSCDISPWDGDLCR